MDVNVASLGCNYVRSAPFPLKPITEEDEGVDTTDPAVLLSALTWYHTLYALGIECSTGNAGPNGDLMLSRIIGTSEDRWWFCKGGEIEYIRWTGHRIAERRTLVVKQ